MKLIIKLSSRSKPIFVNPLSEHSLISILKEYGFKEYTIKRLKEIAHDKDFNGKNITLFRMPKKQGDVISYFSN